MVREAGLEPATFARCGRRSFAELFPGWHDRIRTCIFPVNSRTHYLCLRLCYTPMFAFGAGFEPASPCARLLCQLSYPRTYGTQIANEPRVLPLGGVVGNRTPLAIRHPGYSRARHQNGLPHHVELFLASAMLASFTLPSSLQLQKRTELRGSTIKSRNSQRHLATVS